MFSLTRKDYSDLRELERFQKNVLDYLSFSESKIGDPKKS